MVPPASASCVGVRSLTSVGVVEASVCGGLGEEVGGWFLVVAVGFFIGDFVDDFEAVLGGIGATVPSEATGSRSSSMTAVVSAFRHSSTAPSAVGATWK